MPKRKYVEPLVSTSESDDTEVDTDETPSGDEGQAFETFNAISTQREPLPLCNPSQAIVPDSTQVEPDDEGETQTQAKVRDAQCLPGCGAFFMRRGLNKHQFSCKKFKESRVI